MKKSLVILANGFEAVEAITMIDILRYTQCIEVTTAGLNSTAIRSNLKIGITADTILDEVDPSEFDALILPGGFPGVHHLSRNSTVKEIAFHFANQNKYIAAICAAPIVLSLLGLLKAKQFTCHPTVIDQIDKSSLYKNKPVVSDGNIITTQGPGTVMELALYFIEVLCDKSVMKRIRADVIA